ncbi:Uncharacterized protein T01_4900 [Trichinella spiralis]|uniref:RNA-directed DNA polymerase n=1 Tax=Trichinella spiralis TaxID=6334 RepID=A0A0V1BHR1_TRISP|nr:Uncharacterized protein T01_4900 [Trichinella spiralis]
MVTLKREKCVNHVHGTHGPQLPAVAPQLPRTGRSGGALHGNAVALSRQTCKQCGMGSPFQATSLNAITCGTENMVKQWQEDDPEIQQVITWLSTNNWQDKTPEGNRKLKSFWAQRRRIKMTNGVLTREWEALGTNKKTLLPVIPRTRVPEVLDLIHNHPTGGHLGVAKSLEKIRQRFYWPQQREDVEDWCRLCDACASRKAPQAKARAPMQIQPVGYPFQRVDFWKRANAETAISSLSVTTSQNGQSNTFRRGEELRIDANKELCELFGTLKTSRNAYHPQSDGLVERMEPYSDEYIDQHHTTAATPSRILYGQKQVTSQYIRHFRQDLDRLYSDVRRRAGMKQKRQKDWYDKRVRGTMYEPNDRVWLQVMQSSKIGRKWEGPYQVLKRLDGSTYRVQQCDGQRKVVVHFDRMKLYAERVPKSTKNQPE